MLILDPLRKQRVHADSLGLAFDRDEIDLDQFRIAETRNRLLADHQIDAINLAQAFQPGSEIHRIAEQRVIEMSPRAVIADAAFAGVDADANTDRPEYFPRRLRLSLPAAVEFDQFPPHSLGGTHGIFGMVGIVERRVPK